VCSLSYFIRRLISLSKQNWTCWLPWNLTLFVSWVCKAAPGTPINQAKIKSEVESSENRRRYGKHTHPLKSQQVVLLSGQLISKLTRGHLSRLVVPIGPNCTHLFTNFSAASQKPSVLTRPYPLVSSFIILRDLWPFFVPSVPLVTLCNYH